ncbi:MAG: DUF4275 family protein [Paenibacillus sp.]|uniref:DUF4275 family protein n=1 Tax=Paenibacillus sp. TaxID=58172 RepID=UPI003B775572
MMIRDKINELLDTLPELELNRAYWGIERIHQEYMFKKNLQDKGVVVTELYEESEGIVKQWDRAFANNIDDVVKESIHYSQYKWHMFSYEQQKCLTHDEARDAFNAEPKDEVYVMYENGGWVLLYENANRIIAADFNSEQDIYIFDRAFTWTYVYTHESMCGPYFYKIEQV